MDTEEWLRASHIRLNSIFNSGQNDFAFETLQIVVSGGRIPTKNDAQLVLHAVLHFQFFGRFYLLKSIAWRASANVSPPAKLPLYFKYLS